ncbi:uncharacterized protein [Diadema antillarum]|uniref:uncharacterized protein n=1 Tax=Diadema antillarum TaxID=105358 RepID=UPI003A8C6069
MLNTRCLVIVATVTLIVALDILVVGGFKLERRRGSRRGFPSSRYGTVPGGRRQSASSFQVGLSPQARPQRPQSRFGSPVSSRFLFGQRQPVKSDQGEWFRKEVLRMQNSTKANPTVPPKRQAVQMGPGGIMVNIIETIDTGKGNASQHQSQQQNLQEKQQQQQQQRRRLRPVAKAGNPTTSTSVPRERIRLDRRQFPADEVRVSCAGPNEAMQREECYRFNLATNLDNDTIISRAIVLLPAGASVSLGDPWNGGDRHSQEHCNISIVAKFPTSGETAFSESITAQNMSLDIPSYWHRAALQSGASLISRALREGSTLYLKMSIISEHEGQPTTSNYIPMESSLLPVLIVDVEVNITDFTGDGASSTTPQQNAPNNIVGPLGSLRQRGRREAERKVDQSQAMLEPQEDRKLEHFVKWQTTHKKRKSRSPAGKAIVGRGLSLHP